MKKQIDQYINDHKRNIINDILKLVDIKSVTGNKNENQKALELVLELAKDMGMKTMRTSTNDVGIVEIGSGAEILGILVHVDVVNIGDTDKWTYPAFQGKMSKGFLWGRGVVDNKGPAIMCLYAMKAVLDLKIPLDKRVWLVIGTSEEREWTDIENFKREFDMPNYGFSPDGDFPIFNKEKGYCNIELLFKEPYLKNIEKLISGDSPNTIPSKAVIKLKDDEEMIFHGMSSHSSMPGMGINAINKMIVGLNSHREYNFVVFINDFLAKDYNASKIGIDRGLEGISSALRTVVVPTMIELTEKGVLLNINVRNHFNTTENDILKAFESFKEKFQYEINVLDYLDPMIVDEKEEFIEVMGNVYEEYGFNNSCQIALGTSYAKSMEHFVSWGPIFETEPSCAHMEDERISVDAMVKATQIYALYIGRMASAFGRYKTNLKNMSSLDKALAIMTLFAYEPYEYDVNTIVELTSINRTTVYRNLSSFVDSGILKKDEITKVYSVGEMGYRIGKTYEKEKV